MTGGSTSEVPSGIVMVITIRGIAENRKGEKNQKKKVKGVSGSRGQKPPPTCFLYGGDYIVQDYPKWKVVHGAMTKKQGNV